jgi:hypothetical protein
MERRRPAAVGAAVLCDVTVIAEPRITGRKSGP